MIHDKRGFYITDVSTPEALAEKLTKHSWTLCTGFRFKGYLFLNDSFSEDGAAEYAVVRESDGVGVESITFGWCSEADALRYINQIIDGPNTEYKVVNVRKHPQGSCHLCA
jgi:hypothetical protein